MPDKVRITNYKDLVVWQKSVSLATMVYEITKTFPTTERFGLVAQMRRSAVSVASNVAEGRSRGSRKDFVQFLRIAHGSLSELETQLIIAKQVSLEGKVDYTDIEKQIVEISKMLSSMISKLRA